MKLRLLASVLVILFVPVLFSTPALGASPLLFDFETGTQGWTLPAEGMVHECASHGCALRAVPPCCGTVVATTRTVAIPLEVAPVVETRFMADRTMGGTDVNLMYLDTAHFVVVHITYGNNNQVSVRLDTNSAHAVFSTWAAAHQWYTAKVAFDPVGQTVSASLMDASGSRVGETQSLSLPPGFTSLETLRIESVQWNSDRVNFWFDDITVSTLGGIAWYPDNHGSAYDVAWRARVPEGSSTVEIRDGATQIWYVDEPAAADIPFDDHFRYQLRLSQPHQGSFRLLVGWGDPTTRSFFAHGDSGPIISSGQVTLQGELFSPPFVVPEGQFLAFALDNSDERNLEMPDKSIHLQTGTSATRFEAPASSPSYPLPELSTFVLGLVGLAVVGASRIARHRP